MGGGGNWTEEDAVSHSQQSHWTFITCQLLACGLLRYFNITRYVLTEHCLNYVYDVVGLLFPIKNKMFPQILALLLSAARYRHSITYQQWTLSCPKIPTHSRWGTKNVSHLIAFNFKVSGYPIKGEHGRSEWPKMQVMWFHICNNFIVFVLWSLNVT